MLLSIHTMQNLFAEARGFDTDKRPCFFMICFWWCAQQKTSIGEGTVPEMDFFPTQVLQSEWFRPSNATCTKRTESTDSCTILSLNHSPNIQQNKRVRPFSVKTEHPSSRDRVGGTRGQGSPRWGACPAMMMMTHTWLHRVGGAGLDSGVRVGGGWSSTTTTWQHKAVSAYSRARPISFSQTQSWFYRPVGIFINEDKSSPGEIFTEGGEI